MVWTKAKPRCAEVQPVRCFMFMYKNPIRYSIWRYKEYFIWDEEARQQKLYKEHVHTTSEEFSPASAAKETIDSQCDLEPTNTTILERSSVGYRNAYQL